MTHTKTHIHRYTVALERRARGHSIITFQNKKAMLSQGLPRDAAARSSEVIDFGTNRKRVCDFLLGRHS